MQVNSSFEQDACRVANLLRYLDMFDYPVKIDEITEIFNIPAIELANIVRSLKINHAFEQYGPYLVIPNKKWTIKQRIKAEALYQHHFKYIRRAAKILSFFPFVRGIFLTGSASKGVLYPYEDYDFLVIAEPGKVWLSYFIFNLVKLVVSLNYRLNSFQNFGIAVCIDTNHLKIKDKNEFTALEIVKAIPCYNLNLYYKFLLSNLWVQKFYRLPKLRINKALVNNKAPFFKKILERVIKFVMRVFSLESRLEIELWKRIYSSLLKNGFENNPKKLLEVCNPLFTFPIRARRDLMVSRLKSRDWRGYVDKIRFRYRKRKASHNDLLKNDIILIELDRCKQRRQVTPNKDSILLNELRAMNIEAFLYSTPMKYGMSKFLKEITNQSSGIVVIFVQKKLNL